MCSTAVAQTNNAKDSPGVASVIIQPFVATGEDIITWSTGRPFQPRDFGGIVPDTKEFKNIPTLSAMSIVYSIQPKDSKIIIIKLGTLFFKSQSKIKPNEKEDAFVMEYAQLQFDIEKLYELKLAAFLKHTVFQQANFYPSFINVYNRFHAELIQTRHRLKDECTYANISFIRQKKLRHWQADVAMQLSKLFAK